MTILGVDISEHQLANLPFFEWRERGVRFVFGRVSIGYRMDAQYPRALELARSDGIDHRGGYGVILKRHPDAGAYDPVLQCQVFLRLLIPGLTTLNALDVEVPGLTEPDIRAWCDWYDAHCGQTLLLYGNMYLQTVLGNNPNRYRKYPKWVSDYGYFAPGTNAPPLRSEPFQVAGIPRVPAVGGDMVIWQFAGDNGRLPPYTRPIDLNVFTGTEQELANLFNGSADTPAWTKLGPHHQLGGADTARWLREARPTVAKFVGDFGVANEAHPDTLCVGRMVDDGWLDGQGFDANRYRLEGAQPWVIAAKYAAWLDPHIAANPRIDVWEGPNEQVITTPEAMAWYGEFCWYFAEEIKQRGKRAGIGSWSAGNPAPELWPAWTVALDAIREFDAILCRHDYGPLNPLYGLRYQADAAEFARLRYPNLPVIISECGADDVGGMRAWREYYRNANGDPDPERYWREWVEPYARAIEADPRVLGATLYTVGQHPQFNVDGTPITDWVIERARGNTPPPEGELSMSERERIREHLAAIEAILKEGEAPPKPWWDKPAPYDFIAKPVNPLKLYKPDRVTVTHNLNYTGWAITVAQVDKAGWLKVVDVVGDENDRWLKAADVTPA